MAVMGRPSGYTDEIAADICEWLAAGNSLRSYCEIEGNPSFSMVFRWLDQHEDFREQYTRARETQAHNDGDRMNDIVAQIANGSLSPDKGRVMMDCLKWTAGKRAPKYYGDKVQLSGDSDGAPIVVTWAKPT